MSARKIVEDALRAELLRQSEGIYFWDIADIELFDEGPVEILKMRDARSGKPVDLNDRFDLGAAADVVLRAINEGPAAPPAAEPPITEREKSLLISLWWAVKAAGGRVRVRQAVADKMVYGVDKVEIQPDGHGAVVMRCVR